MVTIENRGMVSNMGSAESRIQSANKLIEGITRLAKEDPFFVLGDFNEIETGKAMGLLRGEPLSLVDSFRVIHPDTNHLGTGNGFTGKRNGKRIDFIFLRQKDTLLDARIIYDEKEGLYPSDHFPVTAKVRMMPNG
jgi:endonuclease/exonuclease/phosphatase family metal-dependent hydrolase